MAQKFQNLVQLQNSTSCCNGLQHGYVSTKSRTKISKLVTYFVQMSMDFSCRSLMGMIHDLSIIEHSGKYPQKIPYPNQWGLMISPDHSISSEHFNQN